MWFRDSQSQPCLPASSAPQAGARALGPDKVFISVSNVDGSEIVFLPPARISARRCSAVVTNRAVGVGTKIGQFVAWPAAVQAASVKNDEGAFADGNQNCLEMRQAPNRKLLVHQGVPHPRFHLGPRLV